MRSAADRARAIAAAAGGAVTSEQTTIDPVDEDRSLATLVLRVPADRLDAVLTDLAELGDLRDQTQSAVDVTGEVVDLEARIATQRASIERVRLLLSKAESIGDVVTIESELTRREADLEALLSRQAALADQAAQSTVTLVVLGPDAAAPEEETGFLAGLRAGWDAFVAASTALLTGLGAVLPFAVLALLLGLPLLAWWRRHATRAEVSAASASEPRRPPARPGRLTQPVSGGRAPGPRRVAAGPGRCRGAPRGPRLKTCPGSPAASASTSSTSRSSTSGGANSAAGSRLPCSALPGPTRRAASASGTRKSTPTTSAPASPMQPQQLAGAHPEVDPRHAQVGHRGQDRGRVRLDEVDVVARGQRARPRVEELHRRGAVLDLQPQERAGDPGQLRQQVVPQRRVAVHQGLGVGVVAGRPALDQVRGQRERRAGEPDERGAAELGAELLDRRQHRGHVVGLQVAQLAEVGPGADRARDDRADPRLDVEVHADRLERHHDVAEEDGRVDAVPAHRLQGDLDDQVGAEARVEHRRALRAPRGTPAASGRPAA